MINPPKCQKCGSEKLSFVQWVYCKMDVKVDDDFHTTYGPPQYDENQHPYFPGYVCRDCDNHTSCGNWLILTEQDLLKYLKMTPEDRQKKEEPFEACEMDYPKEDQVGQEDEEDIFGEPDATEQKEVQHVEAQK